MDINISAIRTDYKKRKLTIKEVENDPMLQFKKWFDEAIQSKVIEPNAMNLATVSKDGRPSSRTVLLKGIQDGKFVFYTNYESRKGRQMEDTPFVAINFFWPELERQVNIEGTVEKADPKMSDEYFQSRPRTSRLGAWVSNQSQPIPNRSYLMKKFLKFLTRFFGRKVPRPPYWGGYIVTPSRIEFWQGRPSRLHDRILFVLNEDQSWEISRLSP